MRPDYYIQDDMGYDGSPDRGVWSSRDSMPSDRRASKAGERYEESIAADGGFVFYDKRGWPIRKISKEFPAFDVVDDYTYREITDGQRVVDINSQNAIWGNLIATRAPLAVVRALYPSGNSEAAQNITDISQANGNLLHVIQESDVVQEEQFDLAVVDQQWGQNSIAIHNILAKYWDIVRVEGRFLVVSHKNKGAAKIVQHMQALDVPAEVVARGRGGVRLIAVLRADRPLETLDTTEEISFEYRKHQFQAMVAPNVFSKSGLDRGTSFLMDCAIDNGIDVGSGVVADFGIGWGAIPMVLSTYYPEARFVGYDNSDTALTLSRQNLDAETVPFVIKADLTDPSTQLQSEFADFIICNPPFHIDAEGSKALFSHAKSVLKKGGQMVFVVERSFAGRFENDAASMLTRLWQRSNGQYVVFCFRK